MERDLKIRRLFDCSPIAWELLAFVAQHRPALCYCSVLLRAVVATLISEWGKASQQSKDAIQDKNSNLLKTTTRLLDIMALGQLLPQPLSSLQHTLHALPPNWVRLSLVLAVRKLISSHKISVVTRKDAAQFSHIKSFIFQNPFFFFQDLFIMQFCLNDINRYPSSR